MSIVSAAMYPVLPAKTVIRQTGAELRAESTGLASTVEAFRGYYDDMVTNAVLSLSNGGKVNRAYLASHFKFPSLLVYGVPMIKEVPGVLNGRLEIEYRGLDPALTYPPPPIYDLQVSSANEPLQTHPKWTSDIAGTASSPLNGAQWVSSTADGTGGVVPRYNPGILYPGTGPDPGFTASVATFYQWLGTSPFAGIEDYLAAGIIYKKKFTTLGAPGDVADVASFDLNPDGPVPALPDNYQWFYLGIDAEDNAGVFLNEASWKAVPSGTAANIIYS